MSGLKLYEIAEDLEATLDLAWAAAEENEGEIPDDLGDKLDELQHQRESKIGNIAKLVKNLTAEGKAVKSEIERLSQRKKSIDRRIEWLKSYLEAYFQEGEKYKDAIVSIYWHKSEAVEVTDESKVPEKYVTETITKKVDKATIKKYLKIGAEIEGVELKQNQSLIIR